MKNFKIIYGLGLFLSLMFLMVYVPAHIELQQDIVSPLKKASDAPTLQSANELLKKAVGNIEKKGLDEGNSYLLYADDNSSLDLWYGQLKLAQIETDKLLSDSSLSRVDMSNHLIKLRETIVDDTNNGTKVTKPPYLQLYPYNWLQVLGIVFSIVTIVLGFVLCIAYLEIEL